MQQYLTPEQVYALNKKHGWFEFADAQGGVSRAFAQDAITMHEAIRQAAPELLTALQAICLAVENLGGEHVTGLQQLFDATELGYAAIKKATGK